MKKGISVVLTICIVLSLVSVSAFADSPWALVASTSTVDGESGGTVNVSFVSTCGDTIYVIEGYWTVFTDTDNVTLTDLSMSDAANSAYEQANNTEYGQTYYNDSTYTGFEVEANAAIVTATYTIAKGTPSGDYTIGFSVEYVEGEDNEAEELKLETKITVTDPEPIPTHTLEKTDAVAATCETAGSIEYYTCSGCGKLFSDVAGTIEIELADTVIGALGHNWDDGVVTTVATCTEDGVKTYTCQNDAGHTKTETIPAAGHDWGEWTVTTVSALGHKWDDGVVTTIAKPEENGIITYTCVHCGATKCEYFSIKYEEPIIVSSEVGGKAIEESLAAPIVATTGYIEANILYYEIDMMVSFDNERSFVPVTKNTMPDGGAVVTIPYPEGTNAAEYEFIVTHRLSDGTIETLVPTKSADGLKVTVKQFNAFAVGYKAIKSNNSTNTDNTGNHNSEGKDNIASPRTGDSNNILLYLSILLSCMIAFAAIIKFSKRRYSRNK